MSDHKELTHPIHGAHSVPACPRCNASWHFGEGTVIKRPGDANYCPHSFHTEPAAQQEQSAAQLAELTAISDALGTNEGHSSVDHIWAIKEQLAAAKADLHNAKKSLARYQEVLDQNSDLKEQLAAANKRAEDAERDAKRYRWLRVCAEDEARLDALDGAPRTPTEFDEAIDEAMGVKNG